MKVVIADGSSLVRERVRALLEKLPGLTISGEASDVNMIYSVCEDVKPELVVLNFHFPEGGGQQVVQSLKQLQNPPIVIVLTNYSTDEYKNVCLNAGADYFLDKSFDIEKLVTIVSDLLP